MIDLTGVEHHPAIEEIVDVLCNKTQNNDRGFFRVETAYFLAKMAASQRATIVTKDRGDIPVNLYVLALATSGYGKGHSVAIIEGEYLAGFKKRFMEETFPIIAEKTMWDLADDRAIRNASDQQEEFDKLKSAFSRAGALPFTFDSGTAPAVKQLRDKLLLAGCGAINLQVDEIGSNLEANVDIMNVYLELYDQGLIKQKLTKNTSESQRNEELDGKTPTNALFFGTGSKLLDGGPTEDRFFQFLDTGYARRCFFGWGKDSDKSYHSLPIEEVYANLISQNNNKALSKWATQFEALADPGMYGWRMQVKDDVGIQLLRYKIECEKAALEMGEHEEIRKAEVSHRYFKALKLAGALAFVDGSIEVEMGHLMSAILLAEESGKSFETLLNREKSYVKLARYICSVNAPLSHADLNEALPFYGRGVGQRNELMTMAMGYAYSRHMVIKKSYMETIELFTGEKLQETDLNQMILSYSGHFAYEYEPIEVPFERLMELTQEKDLHWSNHQFKNGHRARENAAPQFNMIVVDVDGTVSLDTVHDLLKDYKFMTYTTKRHRVVEGKDGDGNDIIGPDRFRVVIPMNYVLKLDNKEYKEFMDNVLTWLPFESDESANEPEKKWQTFDGGTYHYNTEGELLDVLEFIPRTTRNAAFKEQYAKVESLDNLERWFAGRIATGNRNVHMIKYAFALVDNGMSLMEVTKAVHEFNKKLSNPLDESEIDTTILVSVAKRFTRA